MEKLFHLVFVVLECENKHDSARFCTILHTLLAPTSFSPIDRLVMNANVSWDQIVQLEIDWPSLCDLNQNASISAK